MFAPALISISTAVVLLASPSDASCESFDVDSGCQALSSILPTQVFLPGSNVYEYETQNFWSNTEILNPECVFRPESAFAVSAAISTIRSNRTEFAVRGGGHMGIKVIYLCVRLFSGRNADNGMEL